MVHTNAGCGTPNPPPYTRTDEQFWSGFLPHPTPRPPPIPNYGLPVHNERTALQPKEGERSKSAVWIVLSAVVLAFLLFHFTLGPCRDVAEEWAKLQHEKNQWDGRLGLERAKLQGEKDDWDTQLKLKRAKLRDELNLARRKLQGEKDDWDTQLKLERAKLRDELNLARRKLQGEKDDWDTQLQLERAKLRDELNLARRKLQGEKDEWHRRLKLEHETLETVREEEQRREEQWQRDEEARERLGLFWDEPRAESHCLAYGTRKYWSLLRNTVPYNYDWLKPCRELPAVIQGVPRTTDRCEIKADGSGAVYGHWVVDDVMCSPFWSDFKDKGCVAPDSHLHRYEAYLENVPDGEDGMNICSTAPHSFLGRHFDHPHSCMDWGRYGIHANWEVEDPDC